MLFASLNDLTPLKSDLENCSCSSQSQISLTNHNFCSFKVAQLRCLSKGERKLLPPKCKEILEQWWLAHRNSPYLQVGEEQYARAQAKALAGDFSQNQYFHCKLSRQTVLISHTHEQVVYSARYMQSEIWLPLSSGGTSATPFVPMSRWPR